MSTALPGIGPTDQGRGPLLSVTVLWGRGGAGPHWEKAESCRGSFVPAGGGFCPLGLQGAGF